MIKRIGIKNSYAEVSSNGGVVTNFSWWGDQIIFKEHPVGDKSRGGIPICFPFFGSPPEKMKGFPRHGWLRHEELKLVEESDLHVVFTGTNEPIAEYPWLLVYYVTVSIDPHGLILKLLTKRLNDGLGLESQAPINPGFHPYFCSNPHNDYVTKGIARVGSGVITDFLKKSTNISVNDPILVRSGEQTVKMILGGDYNKDSVLTLWSDNINEYFCVEPVLTNPNDFCVLDRGKFLKQGEQSEITMQLIMIK